MNCFPIVCRLAIIRSEILIIKAYLFNFSKASPKETLEKNEFVKSNIQNTRFVLNLWLQTWTEYSIRTFLYFEI